MVWIDIFFIYLQCMKNIFRYVILFMALIACFSTMNAQNNPYRIKDELYGYFIRTENEVYKGRNLAMVDTLYRWAARLKDKKAQCIAIYLRAKYYYETGDVDKQKQILRNTKPFILKANYPQYYFGIWGDIVLFYINKMDFVSAVNELVAYREQAFKLKNDYAITQSYMMHGNMYFKNRHFRLALPYFRDALKYANATGNVNYFGINNSLARSYIALQRWDEAEEAVKDCWKYCLSDGDRIIVYCETITMLCSKTTHDRSRIDKAYTDLQRLCDKNRQYRSHFLYREAMFYYSKYYKNDDVAAAHYIGVGFTPSRLTETMTKARYYEELKDYERSAYYYREYNEEVKLINVEDESFLFKEFVPQLDYYTVQHEKRLLMQKNAQMELRQLMNHKTLMDLNEERDRAHLITRKHEQTILLSKLAAQKAMLDQQNRRLANARLAAEQEHAAARLIGEKNNWRLFFAGATALAVMVVLLIVILERLMAHRRLEEEKNLAIKSEQLRSLFFQNMNHEIRTPLNAIAGFNEVLNGEMSESLTEEEKGNLMNMISTNSELLLTLVNDVLDLSNFESGTYRLKLADVDLNKLCMTAVESIRGRQKENVNLAFVPPEGKPYLLHTDQQRLQQVLTNYLSNACKHTEKGSITLGYEVLPKYVRFSVTDTGSGVKEEDAEKVFGRFQMTKGERSGTGLGLHICRLIADLLHGEVYLDINYKNGARFIFDHPLVMSIIMMIGLFMSWGDAHAVNHRTDANAQLYSYYQRVQKENDVTKALSMADSLIKMAKKTKDMKVQCMALAAKTTFYNRTANTDSLLYNFRRCKDLSVKAKYYIPLYDSWNELVEHYLQKEQFDKALSELMQIQAFATRYHDKYGIMSYYYVAGNYYAMQRQFAAALSYYHQVINYDFQDPNALYSMMGQCYFYLNDYKNAITYMHKSLEMAKTDVDRLTALVVLEKSYSLMNEKSLATKTMLRLMALDQKGFNSAKVQNYHSALYYYYTFIEKDKTKALEEERIAFSDHRSSESGRYFYDIGEYKKANDFFKKQSEEYKRWLRSDQLPTEKLYISKFDFQRAVKEKDLLEYNNLQLKLTEAKNNERVMRLQREKTLWMLKMEESNARKKKWQLSYQNIMLSKRNIDLEKQRILTSGAKKQKQIAEERARWKMISLSFLFLFIVSFIGFYLYNLRRREDRLRLEAMLAKDAEQQKAAFFDNLNKEIHTPLDQIALLNDKLNGKSRQPISYEERINMVRELNNSTSYLTEFVNDVLDMSKMESGSWECKFAECDANEICQHAMDSVKSMSYEDVEFIFMPNNAISHKPEPMMMMVDERLLHAVLTGYLLNAIHRSDRHHTVALGYEQTDNGRIRFYVTDTGRTVTPEDADRLFYFERNEIANRQDALKLHKIRLIGDITQGKAYVDTNYTDGGKFVFEVPISIS
jgi:signal transduction histidine kinase